MLFKINYVTVIVTLTVQAAPCFDICLYQIRAEVKQSFSCAGQALKFAGG